MNKNAIIVGIIVLIILVGAFAYISTQNSDDSNFENTALDTIPDSEFSEVTTNNEIFDEIDSSLNYLDN